jgi:hypothetical protein
MMKEQLRSRNLRPKSYAYPLPPGLGQSAKILKKAGRLAFFKKYAGFFQNLPAFFKNLKKASGIGHMGRPF